MKTAGARGLFLRAQAAAGLQLPSVGSGNPDPACDLLLLGTINDENTVVELLAF